jgi:hypothetical protein
MLHRQESTGALECVSNDPHLDHDEFSSFLESLALPDNLASVPDLDSESLAASCAASGSQPGASDEANAHGLVETAPSSRWSCFVPLKTKSHEPCGVNGKDFSLPTAEAVKLEKVRAKNRRSQHAYRERMKVCASLWGWRDVLCCRKVLKPFCGLLALSAVEPFAHWAPWLHCRCSRLAVKQLINVIHLWRTITGVSHHCQTNSREIYSNVLRPVLWGSRTTIETRCRDT